MATARKKKPKTWRITLLRESLGIVEAATADEAIKAAIKTFGITDPERRRRLVAHRVGS